MVVRAAGGVPAVAVLVSAFLLANAAVVEAEQTDAGTAGIAEGPTDTSPLPSPATSPPALPSIRVRTGEHEGFSRIVFDWPQRVRYRIERAGDLATVVFDRPGRLDLRSLDGRRLARVVDAKVTAGDTGATVTLNLAAGSRVEHFRHGTKVVVDVHGAVPSGREGGAPAPAPAPVPEGVAAAGTAASEATGGMSARGQTSIQDDIAASVDAARKEAEGSTAADPIETTIATQGEPAEPAAERRPIEPGSTVARLRFDWQEPVAAAVFRRGGRLWIVFDVARPLDLQPLRAAGEGAILDVERIPHDTATVLGMTTVDGVNPRLGRAGLSWILDFGAHPLTALEGIEARAEVVSPTGSRLFLPVAEPAEPIAWTDPAVGDTLVVVPVLPLAHGMHRTHAYPQLRLLATAQGLVIEPLADDLRVTSSREGVEITRAGELYISPVPEPMRAGARIGPPQEDGRLLDLAAWTDADPTRFADQRRRLVLAIATSTDDTREARRFDLARFYLAHAFGAETLGVLKLIAEDRPAIETEAGFLAMRGAANVLMGRFAEGHRDLARGSLDGSGEARLWRAALRAAEGALSGSIGELQGDLAIVPGYPKPLRAAVGPALVEAAILQGQPIEAGRLLDLLRSEGLGPGDPAEIGYLEGRLLEANGDADGAIARWTEIEPGAGRRARARALLARTELQWKTGRISAAEAIDALEALRFAWRGDALEFRLLRRLGRLYLDQGRHAEGLRTWREAASHFPELTQTAEVTKDMAAAFEEFFLSADAKTLPPLQAIALYDEFRELTPVGDKGNAMIRKLADRLVEVDLLPRAAALLEDQVRFRLEGVEKADAGARLALVHILDRQPEQALAALQRSTADGLGGSLATQRRHLRARALAETGRRDLALAALEGDDSEEADLLRADIFWDAEDWIRAGEVFRRIVAAEGARPGAGLSDEQAAPVLNLAVALTLAGNERAVARLRSDYERAMDTTSYGDAFRLIVDGEPVDPSQARRIASRVGKAERFRAFLAGLAEDHAREPLDAAN
ncbi:MAG: hypothetical protein ACFCUO_02035 [Rhodospirillales bacterium]